MIINDCRQFTVSNSVSNISKEVCKLIYFYQLKSIQYRLHPNYLHSTLLFIMHSYKSLLQNCLLYKPITINHINNLKQNQNPLHQYLALAALYRYILHNPINNEVSDLFLSFPHQFTSSQLHQIINLYIWKQETTDVQFKQSTSYLKILGDWINIFEQLISKPEAEDQCFSHLLSFINTKTTTYLQRVIFIQQIYDDIRGVINLQHFWESKNETIIAEPQTPVDNLDSLLGILEVITFKSIISFNSGVEKNWMYNPLYKIIEKSHKYQQFVYRGMTYILLHSSMIQKVQKNLTLAILRFVAWTSNDQWAKQLFVQLMKRTSKAVQFALASQYQQTLQIFQHQKRYELVENLEQVFQVRQLIKKKVQSETIEFQQHQRNVASILNGQQKVFYFQVTKAQSIVFLQYYVDVDIGVTITYLGDIDHESKNIYVQETKSKNKSFQILVNNTGLHSIIFDNSYSWMTSKNVVFSLNIFKPEQGYNSDFNLLVYHNEYTPWNERQLQRSSEQKQFIQIWKSNIGQKSDVVFRNQKVFFQGVLLDLDKVQFSDQQIRSIRSILVVGNIDGYRDLLQRLKQKSSKLKITQCDEEDF